MITCFLYHKYRLIDGQSVCINCGHIKLSREDDRDREIIKLDNSRKAKKHRRKKCKEIKANEKRVRQRRRIMGKKAKDLRRYNKKNKRRQERNKTRTKRRVKK